MSGHYGFNVRISLLDGTDSVRPGSNISIAHKAKSSILCFYQAATEQGLIFRYITGNIVSCMTFSKIPVWLAIGKYDYLAGPADQWTPLTKQFSDLTIEIFEHSSHNPPYEEAALFDQKLFEWMELYQ